MTTEGFTRSGICFDDVAIDTIGHRLLVGGIERPLEPKAFAVLVLLASEPGRVFDRNEILDAVWGHSHVTPGVLNRIVALLRHALGESSHEGRYLHTVHGIGYRFDADVHFSGVPGGGAVASVPIDDGALASAADDALLPAPPLVAAAAGLVPVVEVRPRRAWQLAAMILSALLLVALAWIYYGRVHVPVPLPGVARSTPVATRSIIVLPLKVIGASAADAAFADGLGEDLITLLSRVDGVHVIARTSAALAQDSGENLPAIARRLHVGYAIEGSVQHEGDQLRASLRLVDIASAQTLWAAQYDRAATDVFALERDVATSVANVLALKLSARLQADLARSEDSGLYRRYLEARHQLHGDVPLGVGAPRMQAAFRQLVADAPGYARGHAGLALALNQMAFSDPADAASKHVEAVAEAKLALQMDPSLADAYTVLGDDACRRGDWEQGMKLLRRGLELAPADSILRMWYTRDLLTLGYLDQALDEIRIAYAADPLSARVNYQFARVLDTLGQHDEAQRHLDVSHVSHQAAFWFNAVWRGDLAHLQSFVPDDPRFADSYLAAGAALRDPAQWPKARRLIDASEKVAGSSPNWLRVLDPQADVAANIAMLETVWRSGYSGMDSMLWNPELADYRRDAAFQDYVRRSHMLDYWRAHGWPDRCRADGAGVVCS
ncbi:winged helix-turn-helix domain-containing protein [Rhodanobacter sp. AS-Z3]|uniref:winged helix-turn-helix domain-containing protein n=1 Tax=Rhodanobacter sp. AS-Z3 TaxID=3031330 RepID=UPI0024794276|nr:winged helix-turn-helix domain-containing protein [Rhodanobacter sp. AS-Z3]WEN16133.1 winged helix-turn-helix domain-containing protein [Rhodanobacter sp. AS-Z3]